MAFTFAPGRGGQHAARILQGLGGILQGEKDKKIVRGTVLPTNGYAVYNPLLVPDRAILLAYCWSHARRKLIEITRMGPAPIAQEGLRLIRTLYAIEADITGMGPQARLRARQSRSAPVMAELSQRLTHHCARLSA